MGTLILNGDDWSGAPARPHGWADGPGSVPARDVGLVPVPRNGSWEWTRSTRDADRAAARHSVRQTTRLRRLRRRADWPKWLWCVDLLALRRIGAPACSRRRPRPGGPPISILPGRSDNSGARAHHVGLSVWRA